MNRDQFEAELATELARYYPAGAESIAASLKKMRDGDSYADQSVTGAGIAWAAKYAWWAWEQSRAALVAEVMGDLAELSEDADQSKEHAIQNRIRNALAGEALIFRANVGTGWTGSKVEHLEGGHVIIYNARPFSTGLPAGFSDLFGLVPVVITPEMVGQEVAIFTAVEVKTAKGKATEKQAAFIKAVNDNGGRAGVARSPEDAARIVAGEA